MIIRKEKIDLFRNSSFPESALTDSREISGLLDEIALESCKDSGNDDCVSSFERGLIKRLGIRVRELVVFTYPLPPIPYPLPPKPYPLNPKPYPLNPIPYQLSPTNYPLTKGFTLVEMVMSIAVSSIILLALYSSYIMVAEQYERVNASSEVQEFGLPALRLIVRDLRMAGRTGLDANMESSTYGRINNPIVITDSGDACCDSISIIYDLDLATRQRTTYSTAARANPTRNALYMTVDTWDGAVWNNVTNLALLSDYIEDLQFVGSDNNSDGEPTLIDVSITTRSKNVTTRVINYAKPAYNVGNYNLAANDSIFRDEFNATVSIKNLRD